VSTVVGIRNPGSEGIGRYCGRLADALAGVGFDYVLAERPRPDAARHWHLGNSSRSALWQAPPARSPFVVTVHDVVPRSRLLHPLYRLAAFPLVLRRAARVIVHSSFAAELVRRHAHVPAHRIAVIPHPAAERPAVDRDAARAALGWPHEARLAVLPGVIKSAKLVEEAVAASRPLIAEGRWQLALAGRVVDPQAAARAREAGALVLESPSNTDYDRAIAAADAVLVLRSGSVGETNGPLLDAIGAGKAVIATPVGSIPEVAGDAALYCDPDVRGISDALDRLADDAARAELARLAAERSAALTWSSAARAHAALFEEVFDV
jgi:glycosyltransferase involved in cell wall biosynthesis